MLLSKNVVVKPAYRKLERLLLIPFQIMLTMLQLMILSEEILAFIYVVTKLSFVKFKLSK